MQIIHNKRKLGLIFLYHQELDSNYIHLHTITYILNYITSMYIVVLQVNQMKNN